MIRWAMIILVGFVVVGCGSRSVERPILEVATDDSSPFTLSVLEERYDGHTLALQVAMQSRTYWEPKKVLFQLQTLQDGQVAARYRYRLTDLVSPSQLHAVADQSLLAPDSTLQFPVIVRTDEVTDYQISIAWGDDADVEQAELDTPVAEVVLSGLSISAVPVVCPEVECDVYFRIEGVLENRSQRTVDEVALAVAYRASHEASPAHARDGSEVPLTISDLELGAGSTREVRLDLDQALPPAVAAKVMPVVRVVSAR